jgi:hypothetical protein
LPIAPTSSPAFFATLAIARKLSDLEDLDHPYLLQICDSETKWGIGCCEALEKGDPLLRMRPPLQKTFEKEHSTTKVPSTRSDDFPKKQ